MLIKNQYTALFLIFFLFLQYPCAGGKKTYGDVVVKDVVSVYDGDTFKVNIKGYPPIVGEEISIRIAGIDTPEKRGTTGYVKEIAEKARKFTEHKLTHAKKIELRNIRRGKYFRIVADVYVDGVNLAKELIRIGLGKKYGGGTRPSW
jgi:endonuclease YncB( thermonuclease family)